MAELQLVIACGKAPGIAHFKPVHSDGIHPGQTLKGNRVVTVQKIDTVNGNLIEGNATPAVGAQRGAIE